MSPAPPTTPRPAPDPSPLLAVPRLPPTVLDLCLSCLSSEPAERPTSYLAALLLAEEVDARVYVPIADAGVRATTPGTIPSWDQRAIEAATEVAAVEPPAVEPLEAATHVGKHRA